MPRLADIAFMALVIIVVIGGLLEARDERRMRQLAPR